jgi:RNA polymerase sigma-70 factor, ECF subfamily
METSVREDLEDTPTWDGARAGRSFEAFFEAEHHGLYSSLWLVTRNRHEAEEIAQEAFLRLWERWRRVAAMDDPAGYLYRTAMNVYRSRLRRAAVAVRKRTGRLPLDGIEGVEARDSVIRALAALTPRQRAAVVATDLYGFTSEEAAEILGIRASTVRVLVSRARAALREGMREDHA